MQTRTFNPRAIYHSGNEPARLIVTVLYCAVLWPVLLGALLVPAAAESEIAIVSATSSNGQWASPPYPPSYAIDGIVGNSVSATPSTCFHSLIGTAQLSPALTLDLGATYSVTRVVLWPRTECCTTPRNLYWELYIGDSLSQQSNTACTMPFNVTPSPAAPSFGVGPAYGPFNTTVYCSATGRYVILTRPYRAADSTVNNFLQVCEVKVFVAPPSQSSSASLTATGSASTTATQSRTPTQTQSQSTTPTPVVSYAGSSTVGFSVLGAAAGMSFVADHCGVLGAATALSGSAYLTYAGSTAAVPSGNAPKTSIAWIMCRASGLSTNGAAFEFGGGGGSVRARFSVQVRSPTNIAFIGEGNDCTTSYSVCDGSWHHVATVYASPVLTVYVDGTIIRTCTLASAQAIPSSPGVYVGWNGNINHASGELFAGAISQARIFNVPLSASAVAADMGICQSSSPITVSPKDVQPVVYVVSAMRSSNAAHVGNDRRVKHRGVWQLHRPVLLHVSSAVGRWSCAHSHCAPTFSGSGYLINSWYIYRAAAPAGYQISSVYLTYAGVEATYDYCVVRNAAVSTWSTSTSVLKAYSANTGAVLFGPYAGNFGGVVQFDMYSDPSIIYTGCIWTFSVSACPAGSYCVTGGTTVRSW